MDATSEELIHALTDNIQSVLLGKPEVVKLCLVALLAGEHILLEDVPGVGKTLMARALAYSINGIFHRIQFTPDLLPADITGSSVYRPKNTGAETKKTDSSDRELSDEHFTFIPGPIFGNIILADEINRTTPRTQSAMLEAMGEGAVTCDGKTWLLPRPFMVIATQNPLEYEGTYPLPESQLDRFLLRIGIGYPTRDQELEILREHRMGEPIENLSAVMETENVLFLQDQVRKVTLDSTLEEYILNIAEATRTHKACHVGISTRGVLAFYRAAQALALLEGRTYVIPDDLKRLILPVHGHRIIPKNCLYGNQRSVAEAILQEIMEQIPIPG